MLLRRQAIRHRLAGIFVAQFIEREAAGIGQLRGILQRLRPAPEQPLHLVGRFQMPLGIGLQAEAGFLDRHMLADAGQDVLQRAPLRRVIEHIVGGDQGQAMLRAELGELADPSCVIAAIEMADGEMRAPADIVAELLQERGEALVDLLRRQRHQLLAEAMIQHVGVVSRHLPFSVRRLPRVSRVQSRP